MSAAKQIIAATGIATALMATQYAILTRKPRPSDEMTPVFHVGFPHVYTAANTDYKQKDNKVKRGKEAGKITEME